MSFFAALSIFRRELLRQYPGCALIEALLAVAGRCRQVRSVPLGRCTTRWPR
jgi:hypothetical protein